MNRTFDPPAPERAPTASTATRVLGFAVLVGAVVALWAALLASPADKVQQDSVRLMYIHVPSAWLAYAAFFVTALSSALYLWKRTRSERYDLLAGASAELGVIFCGLTLVTGMVWGRATWGVFWTWDARLTTTALLFLLYVGYLALRRTQTDPVGRAKRSAIAALVAFIDVPVVHQSVEWWRTLHQEPTIASRDLDPQIDGTMLVTLLLSMVVFSALYAWLLTHRYRLAWMEREAEAHRLDAALVERLAGDERGRLDEVSTIDVEEVRS